MLLKKKNISSKKVFTKLSKKGRKETVHKQVIIYFYEYILRSEYSQEYSWRIMSRLARHALDNNFLLFEYSSSNVW